MSEFVTIYYVSEPAEIRTDHGPMNCWHVIIEHPDKDGHRILNWFWTYSERLTTLGTKSVEFYKDGKYRDCIRVPRKEQYDQR